jgi:quercetin dioxygenase-like cupin family protein
MPVLHGGPDWKQPEWSTVNWIGDWHAEAGWTLENHYHDCDEYWYILEGKVRAQEDGEDIILGPGDILVTEAGQWHEVVEVLEDARWVYFSTAYKGLCRPGHLTG